VIAIEDLGPRLRRLTIGGPDLTGFPVPLPGASVRLLVPSPGTSRLEMPAWTGNEWLLPGGKRPALRTFTPLAVDPEAGTLAVAVVLHGPGVISDWARTVDAGAPCAVSGPGRGYTVEATAPAFVLVGDETALPAIGQLLEAIPAAATVRVHVEVASPDGRIALPSHPRATVVWHELGDHADPGSAMAIATTTLEIGPDDRIWVAGEAASVQRIRRHLFDTLGVPRSRATVRGYWKRGRAGDVEDSAPD